MNFKIKAKKLEKEIKNKDIQLHKLFRDGITIEESNKLADYIAKAKLTQLKEDINMVEEMIDGEIEIVRRVCLGLVHPKDQNQEEFTKWLQDTVIFHINNLRARLFSKNAIPRKGVK